MPDLRTLTERTRKADCKALGIPYSILDENITRARNILNKQTQDRLKRGGE